VDAAGVLEKSAFAVSRARKSGWVESLPCYLPEDILFCRVCCPQFAGSGLWK
jgi:hypothetical protein